MEQIVLVLSFAYHKKLNIRSATKQVIPKYQPLQSSTYQFDSLKKVINKKLYAKADSKVNKILSCPRI